MEFINRLWHGKYKITDEGAPPPPSGRRPRRRDAWLDSEEGLSQLLRQWMNTPQSGVWRQAKERFQAALGEVEKRQADRAAAAAALKQLPLPATRLTRVQQAIEEAAGRESHCQQALPAADRAMERAQGLLGQAQEARDGHFTRRPGFVVSLSTLGRAGREWHHRDQELAARVEEARRARDAAQAGCDAAHAAVDRAVTEHLACRQTREAAAAELAARQDTVDRARAAWGLHVPMQTWLADDAARELAAPWGDEEISRARSEMLLAALGLHEAFLRCTARTMYANLMAAMDAVAGNVPKTVPKDPLRAAWQSLFLLVPVVSTTFASLNRVFGRLGQEALGWLFIDEAGQATGQMAVGGMWRAARTVVVGDPLQLEPAVVLPWTAQRALGSEFGVDEQRAPSRTSVQQLADRTNRYGTWLPAELPDGQQKVWVGSPLRVHRRCDDPMFCQQRHRLRPPHGLRNPRARRVPPPAPQLLGACERERSRRALDRRGGPRTAPRPGKTP
ncbi:AAA domain-containing protein [Streptomyces sp. NPDC056844]|uniref:AAA domain-containing protein n=1 Tax=unclassified Streptomyces TaxID=2593676 RepID=UPI0036997DB5